MWQWAPIFWRKPGRRSGVFIAYRRRKWLLRNTVCFVYWRSSWITLGIVSLRRGWRRMRSLLLTRRWAIVRRSSRIARIARIYWARWRVPTRRNWVTVYRDMWRLPSRVVLHRRERDGWHPGLIASTSLIVFVMGMGKVIFVFIPPIISGWRREAPPTVVCHALIVWGRERQCEDGGTSCNEIYWSEVPRFNLQGGLSGQGKVSRVNCGCLRAQARSSGATRGSRIYPRVARWKTLQKVDDVYWVPQVSTEGMVMATRRSTLDWGWEASISQLRVEDNRPRT